MMPLPQRLAAAATALAQSAERKSRATAHRQDCRRHDTGAKAHSQECPPAAGRAVPRYVAGGGSGAMIYGMGWICGVALTWGRAAPRIAASGMAVGAGWELRRAIPVGDWLSRLRP